MPISTKRCQSYDMGKQLPIGSMYAIYGNIYHQYTPNVSIYIYHTYGSYGLWLSQLQSSIVLEYPYWITLIGLAMTREHSI